MSPRRLLQSDLSRSLLTLGVVLLLAGAWRSDLLPSTAAHIMADVADSGPSDRDIDLQTQNYYEVLLDVDRSNWLRGGLVRLASRIIKGGQATEEAGNWVRLADSELVALDATAYLPYELKPDQDQIYMSVPVRTNQWGMRDRDYTLEKPPGVFRIGLIGASNDMGYGVEVEKIYPELLEERLNVDLAGGGFDRYEVLNFSVGGYQLIDRLYVADQKVPTFDCDLILVAATMHDLRWAIYERLTQRLVDGRDLHFPFLEEFVADAGIKPGYSTTRISQKLKQRREPLASAVFEQFRKIGEREGVPVVILNFRLRVEEIHPEMIRQTELARAAGLPTLEIFDAYEGQTDRGMYLTALDSHPTVLAHQRLADEVFADMLADPAIRELLLGEQGGPNGEDPHAR